MLLNDVVSTGVELLIVVSWALLQLQIKKELLATVLALTPALAANQIALSKVILSSL